MVNLISKIFYSCDHLGKSVNQKNLISRKLHSKTDASSASKCKIYVFPLHFNHKYLFTVKTHVPGT